MEIVNLGDTPVNLGNWTLVRRHPGSGVAGSEEPACIVPSQSALVIFGGPVGTHEPGLVEPQLRPFPVLSPSGLRRTWTQQHGRHLMLRNAEGHLVERVVYGARNVSEDGSMVRWPLPDGPWKPHTQVDPTRGASPGSPPTGTEWIPGIHLPQLKLGCVLESDHIRLFWAAEPGSSYTIRELTWESGGKVLAEGFQGGEFLISLGTAGDRWFQVTSPRGGPRSSRDGRYRNSNSK